jgi:uncharacterized protein (TIGR02300 family)
MSKPARGTKRVCPSCGARFYDLNRTPISCPLCQAVYQAPVATSRRSERAQPAEEKKTEEAEAPRVVERTATVSLEEAEEAGAEADDVSDDEEIVDLGDDEPDIPPSDDDDTFLEEEEEEGETDVSKIVPSPGEDT